MVLNPLTPPSISLKVSSLQKGALVDCTYLYYRNIRRNYFTFKSLFFKEGFREIF